MGRARIFFISSIVLGLLTSQGFGATQEELLKKIEDLSKELEALKAQLKELRRNKPPKRKKFPKWREQLSPLLIVLARLKLVET
ncbi:MAG: DUF5320 domain-containing protein [Caldimicrobium sp.]